MRISIVIPTYNEKENVGILIPKIFKIFEKNHMDADVIIVDDNSPDNTAEEVKKLQKSYELDLIERPKKMGIGSAYIEGFKHAMKKRSEIIFEMDADLSHDPEDIPKFLEKMEDGYDVVVGSRLVEDGGVTGWGIGRKAISFGGNLVGRKIAGIDVSDLTSGYRAYRTEVLEKIKLDELKSKSYDFQLDMLHKTGKNGSNIGVVPITFRDRTTGKSKLSKMDILRFLLTAIKIRINDK